MNRGEQKNILVTCL